MMPLKNIILPFLVAFVGQWGFAQVQVNSSGMNVCDRFDPPEGFERIPIHHESFANYLRNLPLKDHNVPVQYFDGRIKNKTDVHAAVVDLPIGRKDLHQCADAIIRLRAEYLYEAQEFDQIHFNFTNGMEVAYEEWMKGRRMVVKGNQTYWNDRSEFSNTYKDFWAYLELIFTYAGTQSLSQELLKRSWSEMQIGDVLIQGGFPGHAVLVLDMAENDSGEKVYLLGQSYMPAQEFHVLENPNSKNSPWYMLDSSPIINTPEWTFNSENLKAFD